MVLDSKILTVRQAFNVQSLADWSRVSPQDVVALDGIGPATLDHIRLYLCGQDQTLKDDRTPEYWHQELGRARVVHQMARDDRGEICPFTICVDSAEQQPFGFEGLRCDADKQNRPLLVKTTWQSLGRHPDSLGDYSIEGYVGRCHVERKSVEDFQGTLLGFKSDRRERFECELSNLAKVEAAAVVVEGSFLDSIQVMHDHGEKPSDIGEKPLAIGCWPS